MRLCKCSKTFKLCWFLFPCIFQISGREMFEFNPDLMTGDDDDAAGDIVYERDEDDSEEVRFIPRPGFNPRVGSKTWFHIFVWSCL